VDLEEGSHMHSEDVRARFDSNVHTEPNTGCWLWGGGLNNRGRGCIGIDGKTQKAHRVSWEIANGRPVPDGLHVLHACDVTWCVNPAHLSVGTHAENMADMVLKGRQAHNRGELSPTAKLDAGQVRVILSLKGRESASAVALRFRVTVGHVRNIWAGLKWAHLREAA
jgi:hypothetical protein